ncbi:MAG: alanine--tRNA ligase, partial [Clostridia bacterium]|nr:alanine--tRNA ligase [Clostridia bacterium]
KKDYILKVLSMEEDRFAATIDAGLNILNSMIEDTKAAGNTTLAGDDAFKLYDTYGFPIDLTREIAEEAGLTIDNDRFTALMQEQRTRAREARANISGWANASGSLLTDLPKTEFVGYTEEVCDAKVLAIVVDDGLVDQVNEGEFTLILDKTPFYGEGGGQVGDEGSIYGPDTMALVLDTKKTDGIYLHMCNMNVGAIRVGDTLKAHINTARREAIMRNHSAAHLLQNAVREVLGNHVEQAGSFVSDTVCRFDFTHFAALTSEEIGKVEWLVNAEILKAGEGSMTEMPIDEAKKLGAMALFGEKYGKTVRVVRMGSKSIELCGGTHVDNTGKIGLFKIVGESSVAAGVRRIEAVTGTGVLALLAGKDALLHEVARELKVPNVSDVAKKATALQGEIANAKKEIESLNAKLAGGKLDAILASAVDVNGVMLVAARAEGMNVDMARTLVDDIKAKYENAVVVLAVEADGKLNFLAGAGKDAVAKGAHAGKLVGAVAAVTGGKGGGRPDNAMAGGRDASQIDAALACAKTTLEGMIK